jgi:SAM-dependent methyltransferase
MERAPVSAARASWRDEAHWLADATRVHDAERREHPATGAVIEGDCQICGGHVRVDTAGQSINLREGLACEARGCNARQRAAAAVLLDLVAQQQRPRVYATEQASPFYVALKRRLPALRGSEFVRDLRLRASLSKWLWRQGVHEWVRHGDLTALRMRSASLDAIVSLDVLEHIPDHRAALRECARVLKPGAPLVLTVPFQETLPSTRTLARVRADGRIEHLHEPEYHGDPVSGGVLCFHHFGWSLLDDMRQAGFGDVAMHRVHAVDGAVPEAQWVLVARR